MHHRLRSSSSAFKNQKDPKIWFASRSGLNGLKRAFARRRDDPACRPRPVTGPYASTTLLFASTSVLTTTTITTITTTTT